MASGEVFPIINCADLARARRFYEGLFGGVVSYQSPPEGDAEFLTLAVGSGTIALGVGTVAAAYGDVPLPATGHAVDLCIYVEDLDRVANAVGDHGGSLVTEPALMPWGERVAYLRDPEGTMVLVIQDS